MAEQIYNLSQLEELAGGNTEFVDSMVDTFLEHTPGQLEEILQAFKISDLATVGAVAHKIKPNIELFGINTIKQDIRVVEEKGKQGVTDAELETSLKRVELHLKEAFNQLQQR
ncbi:Hpt domain-containing protein [Owenweeksia hongkongensis]|uniref:Hpt domain-containing protein n=1 Tax=Owenweeksia hongkongensis TaxID=253245 RepID=UPI003A9347FC